MPCIRSTYETENVCVILPLCVGTIHAATTFSGEGREREREREERKREWRERERNV